MNNRPIVISKHNTFNPQPKPVKVIKPKYNLKAETAKKVKSSGEKPFFNVLSKSRKHVSFVSGIFLGTDLQAWHFAHCIPKGKYPEFRLKSKNIVFLTQDEHMDWDQSPRSELKLLPEWKKMFDLEAELKKEYSKLKLKK